jgi:hypothetical protein
MKKAYRGFFLSPDMFPTFRSEQAFSSREVVPSIMSDRF